MCLHNTGLSADALAWSIGMTLDELISNLQIIRKNAGEDTPIRALH
jgi:hypothetical protein